MEDNLGINTCEGVRVPVGWGKKVGLYVVAMEPRLFPMGSSGAAAAFQR